MTETQIKQGQIIAEFQGKKTGIRTEKDGSRVLLIKHGDDGIWEPSQYHLSFDWLRPVWDKWRSLPIPHEYTERMIDVKFYKDIKDAFAFCNPAEILAKMAEAIQWYNSTKKN